MKQILCFGDSNTWGLSPQTKTRYQSDIRWSGILDANLKEKQVKVIEEGLCGRTAVFEDELRMGRNGSKILPVLLESHAPLDVIILMLGTNDCKRFYNASAPVIGKGIALLLDQIRQYAKDSHVLLVSPIHLGDEVYRDEYDPEFSPESVKVSRQLKDVYQKLAGERNIRFLAASDYAAPSPFDQEHLDEAGHASLAGVISEAIADWVA